MILDIFQHPGSTFSHLLLLLHTQTPIFPLIN
jgi:hypothetical protein